MDCNNNLLGLLGYVGQNQKTGSGTGNGKKKTVKDNFSFQMLALLIALAF